MASLAFVASDASTTKAASDAARFVYDGLFLSGDSLSTVIGAFSAYVFYGILLCAICTAFGLVIWFLWDLIRF